MKKYSFTLLLLVSFYSFAQQISGTVVDAQLNEPIPFVNIQLTDNKGTITNLEGVFRLEVEAYKPTDIVIFSSMGFEEFQISIEQLQKNSEIILKPSNELLEQVVVTNKQLTAQEIIQKFIENREVNHQLGNKRYRLFYRNRSNYRPAQTLFELKKASNLKKQERKRINQAMEDFDNEISGSNSLGFYESLRDLYVLDDTSYVDIKKKIYLADSDVKGGIDDYQKEAIEKLFENFKSDYTFKIKIGFIRIEDSLEINSSDEAISIQTSNEDEFDEEDGTETDSINIKKSKYEDISIEDYPELAFTNEYDLPDVITETKYYDYELEDATYIKGRPQYVINFEPGRRKGKYEGKMYIDQEDYALTQIDYKLAEGKKLMNFNLKLLGIKFNQFKSEKSIRFTKTDEGFYVPYYGSSSSAQYVFLSRTLTFIENNPNRRERIKFKLGFIIEIVNEATSEWVLLEQENIENKNLTPANFSSYLETENIETYDPKIWKDYPIFEATTEMKQYHFKK